MNVGFYFATNQGLIILMHLSSLVRRLSEVTIKFINPIYSNEDIYIKKEPDTILWYVNNVLCFKCNFTEYIEMWGLKWKQEN